MLCDQSAQESERLRKIKQYLNCILEDGKEVARWSGVGKHERRKCPWHDLGRWSSSQIDWAGELVADKRQ